MNQNQNQNQNQNPLNLKSYEKGKADIAVKYYNKEFEEGERILDPWQRQDRWELYYKMAFILSILVGNDIPKIMEYTLINDETKKKRILDGGHRTRSINEYINGEFSIKIGENYYYWSVPSVQEEKRRGKSKNKNLELPAEYKHRFLNYNLTITTYIDLTEEEAREKFNELNHCNPMIDAEVINSHSSLLVDNLRILWDIDDSELVENLKKMFSISNKMLEKLNYMKILVSLFSLVERGGKEDVFSYCEPKNALSYVRSNDHEKLNTQFSMVEFEVPWSRFKDSYENYQEWIEKMFENGFNLLTHSESLTYFHYINHCGANMTEEDNDKILKFSSDYSRYKKESQIYDKELKNVKNKPLSQIRDIQGKLKELNEDVGAHVVEWSSTFQNNGAGKGNMKKRKEILDKVLQ